MWELCEISLDKLRENNLNFSVLIERAYIAKNAITADQKSAVICLFDSIKSECFKKIFKPKEKKMGFSPDFCTQELLSMLYYKCNFKGVCKNNHSDMLIPQQTTGRK